MLKVHKRRLKPTSRRRVCHCAVTTLPVHSFTKQHLSPMTDPAALEGTMEIDPAHNESFAVDSDSMPPSTEYTTREQHPRPNRTKRSWSDEEDLMLTNIMVELHGTGRYKADRGFKPGLYAAVEKEFEKRCPGAGIHADPHIYSRVKTMKAHFNIVSEMIHTSGFGWDDERKCVTTDDANWNDYIRSHKSAVQFRGKIFKFLDQLTVLFGTDHANGSSGLVHGDAVQTSSRPMSHGPADMPSFQSSQNIASQSVREFGAPYQSSDSSAVSGGRKRKSINNNDSDSRAVVVELMMDRLMIVTNKMCDAMKYDALTYKQENLMVALRAIEGLIATDRLEVHELIWHDAYKLQLFYSLEEEEKPNWVKRQLRGR